jgi:hypothetical protein
MSLCECNQCGLEVKPGRRFISGHNTRINNPMSNTEARGKYDEYQKEQKGKNRPRCIFSEEWREKQRKAHIGRIRGPFKEETKKKMSESAKNKPLDSEETKKRKSSASKIRWMNLDYRNKMIQLGNELWRKPEYIAKQIESRSCRPNKLEFKFGEMLNNLQPNEWKYVGDFEFFLGGRCPDFMNINGKKKLIELYGNYWHQDENPQERIEHFKQYGFDTIIIWESELKHMEKVREKIIDFSGR